MTSGSRDSEARVTERHMLNAVRNYFGEANTAPRYVVAEQVAFADGGARLRRCDALVQDLWQADDLALHGIEVKVSRADWLAELRDRTKAETFRRYVDRWWLAVSDYRIAADNLPKGWGLLVLDNSGRSLYVGKKAPRLVPDPMPRQLRSEMLRSAVRTARS